jgi:hypothetical protein
MLPRIRIKSFLFQVTPHDPPTLAAAVAVLAAAALT